MDNADLNHLMALLNNLAETADALEALPVIPYAERTETNLAPSRQLAGRKFMVEAEILAFARSMRKE